MKIFTTIMVTMLLTACVSIPIEIPSFWDDNQSAAIVSVRQAIENINCAEPHAPQAQAVQQKLRWFELYSDSKGSRQQDVLRLVGPMKDTIDDFARRSAEKQGSKTYCELKKSAMVNQASTVARAVLGRF
jgi:hypothetical protein